MLPPKISNHPFLLIPTERSNRYLLLGGDTCWSIGRGSDNHFRLVDGFVSRHHAILQCNENGAFYLIDLISTNGSFVNGCRVTIPVKLQNGDRITLGQTDLKFYCPPTHRCCQPQATADTCDCPLATRFVWRLVSVVVIDIRNFTGLSQQMEREALKTAIDTWFGDIVNIISASGGMVDKNIGDAVGAIKAIWFHRYLGVSNQDILRVFQAIRAINQRTMQLNQKFPFPFPLKIGAGINTDYGIVDNTRMGEYPYYLALEPTVKEAFRLGTATQEIGCDVALAESTYRYLSTLNNLESVFQEYTVQHQGYKSSTVTYAGLFADLDLFLQ